MNDLVVVKTSEWDFAHFKDEQGKRWYDLGRIAKSLGIQRVSDLAERIPEQHKQLVNIRGLHIQLKQVQQDNEYCGSEAQYSERGNPNKWFVDEAGMYRAIMRSDSPKAEAFTEWVTAIVIPSIISTGTYSVTGKAPVPPFLFHIRAQQNYTRVPVTHFSVISQLEVQLYGKLEMAGYRIADKSPKGQELRPDISVGKLWAKYLAEHYPEDINRFREYQHQLPNGMEVPSRMYELDLLPKFILFVENVWIKENAFRYFEHRDLKAVDYLLRLIPDIKIPRQEIA